MDLGIYMSAAGALTAEARMDVIANNIANSSTPGFKRAIAVFQERPSEVFEPPHVEPTGRPDLDRIGGGLFVHEVAYDPRQGTLQRTEGALDLALHGDGWFAVERGGETLYTRAGNFQRAADGSLVTAAGDARVLDTRGKPVVLPTEGEITVDERGVIRVGERTIARIEPRGRVDHRLYEPTGNTLYRRLGSGAPVASGASIKQGHVEGSTVEPVREMVAMIRAFRAYEANQRMITQQDQVLGRTVNDVGRVG